MDRKRSLYEQGGMERSKSMRIAAPPSQQGEEDYDYSLGVAAHGGYRRVFQKEAIDTGLEELLTPGYTTGTASELADTAARAGTGPFFRLTAAGLTGSRLPPALDPPRRSALLMQPQAGKARVIISPGRGQPAAPQSGIVMTAIMDKNFMYDRQNTPPNEQRCPVGSTTAFRGMQGEWVFADVKPRHGSRLTIQQYTDLDVWTAVNGMSKFREAFFVGNMQGEGSDPSDPQNDEAVTTLVAGVATGINTGPAEIPPFTRVAFTLDPYCVSENGQMTPAVQEDGNHPEKFRPTTYPYTEDNVGAALLRVQMLVDDQVKRYIVERKLLAEGKGAFSGGGVTEPTRLEAFFSGVGNFQGLLSPGSAFKNHFASAAFGWDTHPLELYGLWYALGQMVSLRSTFGGHIGAGVPELQRAQDRWMTFVKLMRLTLSKQLNNTNVKDYNSAIGGRISQENKGEHFQRNWDKDQTQQVITAAPFAPLVRPFGGAVTALVQYEDLMMHFDDPAVAECLEWIELQKRHCIQAQHEYNQRHVMGISLANSAPGKRLDILMGFYN